MGVSTLDAGTSDTVVDGGDVDLAVAIDMAIIDAEVVDTVEQEPDIGPILIRMMNARCRRLWAV